MGAKQQDISVSANAKSEVDAERTRPPALQQLNMPSSPGKDASEWASRLSEDTIILGGASKDFEQKIGSFTYQISQYDDRDGEGKVSIVHRSHSMPKPQIKENETAEQLHERLRDAVAANTRIVARPTLFQSEIAYISANLEKETGIKGLVALATTTCVHEFLPVEQVMEPYRVLIGIEAEKGIAEKYFPNRSPSRPYRVILPPDPSTIAEMGPDLINLAYDALKAPPLSRLDRLINLPGKLFNLDN